jgi:protein TonB
MEKNKILSSSFLDLLFDNRNKEYGAYELRKTYNNRIAKSLLFTGAFILASFTGVVLANKIKPPIPIITMGKEVTIQDIDPIEPEPEPLPEPEPQPEPKPIRTEQLTQFKIVEDNQVVEPPPSQDELKNAKIDVYRQEGIDETDISTPVTDGIGKGIVEAKPESKEQPPFERVEIEAKFIGNWEKFLLRNLNPAVPVDNNAPEGNYTVLIQFVVDIDGSVSDIKALTNHGYGVEQEAIRVLKKASKWEAAFQNGNKVKAYRKQSITFQVQPQ